MAWTARMASLWRRVFDRQRVERELDSEVRGFFEIRVERLVEQGMTRAEAERAARREGDGPEQVKEKVRDARVGAAMETVVQDLRYAGRVLWASPGFTSIAVLTLALGIGANTAIFSLMDAVMLKMLPVEHPEQLVLLTDPAEHGVSMDTTENGVRERLSYPDFEELRAGNKVFSGMFAAQNETSELDVFPEGSGRAMKAHTQLVSGEFFDVLGVQAALGRVFTHEEDRAPGANPVAVISYDFWQRALGGDPAAVGSSFRIGHAMLRVVGIAPQGFRGMLIGFDTDFWIPITMQAEVLPGWDYLKPRDTLWLQVMARIAPGLSKQAAEAGINVAFQQALQAGLAALPAGTDTRQRLNQKIVLRDGARGASSVRGQFSDPLVLLMAMVGVVLLIACANIANLMLARTSGRQREIGVRLALGAARGRLIRQLLTEALVVAAMGGALGMAIAAAGAQLLLALVEGGYTNLHLEVPRDYRVLLFTAAISLGTGILFGIAPAMRATRQDVNPSLAANARGSIGGRGRAKTGRILAVAQVALSLVLLMGAALFVRSLHKLITQRLGYDRAHLLLVRIDPVAAGYKGESVKAVYQSVREALRTIPGVREATLSDSGLFASDAGDSLWIEGSPVKDRKKLDARWTEVGPAYFKTLQIPVLAGREIDAADAARGAAVCVVNESFARMYFEDANPIGKHIRDEYPTTRETYEIVGVVADAKEHSAYEPPRARFYPNLLHPIGAVQGVTFVVNTSGDPASVGGAVRRAVAGVDANLPIVSLRTLDEQLHRRLISERIMAQLASFFGAVALFMAAIGMYGVMSYAVSKRTSEIGIRVALGASRGTIARMVVGETFGVVGIGVAIGFPCALAAGRLISSRLYGLSAADPIAIAAPALIILGTAAIAAIVPARRAAGVDPVIALRAD